MYLKKMKKYMIALTMNLVIDNDRGRSKPRTIIEITKISREKEKKKNSETKSNFPSGGIREFRLSCFINIQGTQDILQEWLRMVIGWGKNEGNEFGTHV